MTKRPLSLILTLVFLFLTACTGPQREPAVSPTGETAVVESTQAPTLAPPEEPTVLISEVLTGISGNNNYDYIEIYNTGSEEPIDLKGWSIWFKLADGQDEILVIRWKEHTLIPPLGHYLLVRSGQDVGVEADAYFEQSLVGFKGGLQLRDTGGGVVDSVVWGDGPEDFVEGRPSPAVQSGYVLERGPGGEAGNWYDQDDNAKDFVLTEAFYPQNTGSELTPGGGPYLALRVEAPASTPPGSEFDYVLTVHNKTGKAVHGVTVQFPILLELEVVQTPEGVLLSDQATFWGLEHVAENYQIAFWTVGDLEAEETTSIKITVRAPWTVFTAQTFNYSVQAEDWPTPGFGAPVRTAVEGGVIPIAALKELVGAEMAIEGVVTLQTGALYAGGGNVKFYLEDETGGVQVWVPGGEGEVAVGIGARVRAFGELTVYRGALELIVNNPEDVEILAGSAESEPPVPTPMTIADAKNNPDLRGLLGQVEGLVTRVDEYTYSYGIDLMDDAGETLSVYVDKLTGINVEGIEEGQLYRVTGIVEVYNTKQQLYPRIQSDFERIFPPVLMLEMDAPNTVKTNEILEITLTAYNHTPDPMTNLTIVAAVPNRGTAFVAASDGGEVSGSNVIWRIPNLEGNGASVSVSYQVKATAEDGYLTFQDYSATANEWPEPTGGSPYFVFLGEAVPIWAIQGPGDRSPYVLDPVTTAGTVTGIFPELEGFWIQELETDSDPLTSSGLFVFAGDWDVSVVMGDEVRIDGVVRETYQQTQIWVSDPEDVVVLGHDGRLPQAVELDPPPSEEDALGYYEALEGMLVQVTAPARVVGPTSKYGEYVLVLEEYGIDRLWQGDTDHNGLAIMVDDGSYAVHRDRSTLEYVVNVGDRVSGLVGPLAYTYGRYKIEPITIPQVESQAWELPSLQPTGPDEFSIMTWNVENLFDIRDPHPSNPPKPSVSEYKVDIAKVANTIIAAGAPTIVGLQEVENIGILEDVAEHESLASYQYQPYLIEGTDGRGIDNGYLVRGDVAEVVNVEQFIAPEGLTSRPPLVIEVRVKTGAGDVTIFVANNHFTSMSAGIEATEPRRTAQAEWNIEVMESVLAETPQAYYAVIGDLNSFFDSLPIDTLRAAGLAHVFDVLSASERYNYIYQGASQTLDHILVTPSLFDLLLRVEILHVNADFAPPLSGDESPLRKSDHDPIVATFSLNAK